MSIVSCLKKAPKRNKDLVFGYIKIQQNKNKINYPELIKYLCFGYFQLVKDEIIELNNPIHKNKDCQIKYLKIEKDRICVDDKDSNCNVQFDAPLENQVNEGINEWIFKINCMGSMDKIGIISKEDNHDEKVFGYAIVIKKQYLSRIKDDKEELSGLILSESKLKIKNGDTLKMTLDCINWELSFEVNQNGSVCVFGKNAIENIQIEKKTYSAIIGISTISKCDYQLLSFKMTY